MLVISEFCLKSLFIEGKASRDKWCRFQGEKKKKVGKEQGQKGIEKISTDWETKTNKNIYPEIHTHFQVCKNFRKESNMDTQLHKHFTSKQGITLF